MEEWDILQESVSNSVQGEAVTVIGVSQHAVAAEEEKTMAIRAGGVETSIVNQQPARANMANMATQEQAHGWQQRTQHTAAR